MAGQMMRNCDLPVARRVDAAFVLGNCGYTGGYVLATQAAEYMPDMMELLRTPDLDENHIIRVLEGLSLICYVHYGNQNKALKLGLHETLQELIAPASQFPTGAKRWSCYLLNILCWNNVPLIRHLRNSEDLKTSLELLEHLDWGSWPENYPQELLQLLGFWQHSSN